MVNHAVLYKNPQEKRTDVVMQEKPADKEENAVRTQDVSKVLYRAKGVWPFDFVPDEFIVEETRLVLIYKYFPFGSYIGTLTMDKLSSIEVSHSIFFSAISLESSELHGFNATFKWLTHKDAHRIKEIVDGIKVSELSHINIPQSTPANISKTLESLGHI